MLLTLYFDVFFRHHFFPSHPFLQKKIHVKKNIMSSVFPKVKGFSKSKASSLCQNLFSKPKRFSGQRLFFFQKSFFKFKTIAVKTKKITQMFLSFFFKSKHFLIPNFFFNNTFKFNSFPVKKFKKKSRVKKI